MIQSGSGLVVGKADLIDCKELSLSEYQSSSDKHQIYDGLDSLPYKRTFAWILKNPIRYKKPRPYKHPNGAIIWVNLNEK